MQTGEAAFFYAQGEKLTPTQLSIKRLKEQGYFVKVVETWNPWARIRQDLFGAIDIVAIKATEPGVIGIQATTTPNMNARITKAQALPAISAWVSAGNPFLVWGWAKQGARGKRKTWTLKEVKFPVIN